MIRHLARTGGNSNRHLRANTFDHTPELKGDAAGRHGVGVTVADNSDGDRITLIFDRNTYQYVGMSGADHLGRGESTALLSSGLVNQAGQTP